MTLRRDGPDGDDPLVTVVLPTYDRPALVREAARTVAAQTYDRVELVVVDDHSPRPARAALAGADLGLAVRHVRLPENRGVSAARNAGVAAARGDFVAFLDDDDRWDERKLALQVAAFRRGGDRVGLVYTGVTYTDGEDATVGAPTLRGDVERDLLVGRPLAPTSAVMVRPRALAAAGGFDEGMPSWNDRDLYLRLSHHCEFEPVPEPLTVRRTGHGRDQISGDYETKRDVSCPRFLAKHGPTAADYGPVCERRFRAAVSLMLAKSALVNGHHREARRHFAGAVRWWPLDPEPYPYLLFSGRASYRVARAARAAVGRVAALVGQR